MLQQISNGKGIYREAIGANDNLLVVDLFTREINKLDGSVDCKEILSQNSNGHFKNIEEVESYCKTYDVLDICYYNITYACNMRCKYCYATSAPKNFVDKETNLKIINRLNGLNTKSLVLIGGEPFVHPHFKELLIDIIHNFQGENISIVTNGLSIRDEYLPILRDHNIDLQVSLDGYSEETNAKTRGKQTFDKILLNVIKCKEYGIPIKIMKTVTAENIGTSVDFYNYYKGLGIPAGFFIVKENISSEVNRASVEDVLKLVQEIYAIENNIYHAIDTVKFADNMHFAQTGFPSIHCGAGINAISVSPNGDIFPCVKMVVDEYKMGSLVNDEGLLQFKKMRRDLILPTVDKIKKCSDCQIKYFCGGGCRAERTAKVPASGQCNCTYYFKVLELFLKTRLNDND